MSFAGVSDLPDLIRREKRYIDGRHSTRFIGDLWRDRKMLTENSPARRAEDIQVPVLLMHGDKDTVVDVSQSKLMAKRLRKYDKDHQLIILEGGSHHLSLYRNRLRYLQETERFLSSCIGPE
ncbi:MAG: alpha/beta hydrolase family protein [Woeseiaceae bacterium]